MASVFSRPELTTPTLPEGVEVASFQSYQLAESAIDQLAESSYPVEELSIVGTDLRMVEHITGRLTVGRVAVSGLASGIWLGIFLGIFLSLTQPDGSALLLIGLGALLGAAFGLVLALVPYFLGGKRRRDFTSAKHVVAARYAVIAAKDGAKARQALAGAPGNMLPAERQAQERAAASGAPTQFGFRIDEKPRFGVRLSAEERARRQAEQEGYSQTSAATAQIPPTPGAPVPPPGTQPEVSAKPIGESEGQNSGQKPAATPETDMSESGEKGVGEVGATNSGTKPPNPFKR